MRTAGKLFIALGILLILFSVVFTVYMYISADKAQSDTAEAVEQIKKLLPPESIGSVDNYSSMEMPALHLDDRDIIALLEIEKTGTALPVVSFWDPNDLIRFPRRFSGSCYDSSLIIGGNDRAGQFDCLEKLDVKDVVSVTDMTGAKFSYTVAHIERKNSAETDILVDPEFDLTLFVRDSGTLEYIIVRCKR